MMIDRRQKAIACARMAVRELAELGVGVRIVGSLARGDFGPDSDVDFLVLSCPQRLKYAIEIVVEAALDGLPFDVLYFDEVPVERTRRLLNEMMDASDLQ